MRAMVTPQFGAPDLFEERDVERAIADFKESEKRLYRRDATKVYGEAEHSERLGKLTAELSEKVEAVSPRPRRTLPSTNRKLSRSPTPIPRRGL